jgi:hypothetical protein
LEILFCFLALVDEDDLFFHFFGRSATVGRTGKTILAAGTMLASVVAGFIFFFFFLGGPTWIDIFFRVRYMDRYVTN